MKHEININKNARTHTKIQMNAGGRGESPELLKTLSDILNHGGNSQVARMAAGSQLKNHLDAKDPTVKLEYQQRWRSIPEETRNYIKKNVSAILGGLQATSTLKPLVEQAMPTLIELMYDSSVVVRDTAAWTFGRICEIVPEAATNETFLKPLLKSLIDGLKAEPRVAANVCWAFTGLAEASYEQAEVDGVQPETYVLSPYFEFLVQNLLETTDRPDGAQANLRSAAYEALMELIKNSPKDCYGTVQRTTMVILERLNQVLAMEHQIQNHSDRAQFNDLQGLLCATLQVGGAKMFSDCISIFQHCFMLTILEQSVLRKMTEEDAPQISDPIMNALLSMFNSNSCKAGSVQEDAIMAVSTLVEVLGEGFIKYMPSFLPFLCMGLKNHSEYQVSNLTIAQFR
ncbi:unnamed protein product [Nesidiocoris tenuis]|uniref:Importin N-terminal domain-containing protein n=1 Tax=Nesidiocoris tenuis TaxID=355587 RepID=A0A6H5GGM0_9HEMI|nr:unnamed protein product [Nesidiocoris tenuis]